MIPFSALTLVNRKGIGLLKSLSHLPEQVEAENQGRTS